MVKSFRDDEKFGDGFNDGFKPLESLDLKKITDFDQLLSAMSKTAFNGRRLGEAADVLEEMIADEDCLVVGTFSGAMTVAKMGTIICDMLDWGWLDVIISTGALMAHGLVEAVGMRHFKYDFSMNDKELFHKGYDRVYDTLELEKNLDDLEVIISKILLDDVNFDKKLSSEKLCRIIGKWLIENTEGAGILKSAYTREVPVYVPAFTDSEMGLDIATLMVKMMLRHNPHTTLGEALRNPDFTFDPFLDLGSYAEKVMDAKRIGIFTIGGGVPRNWAQQVSPFLDIVRLRTGIQTPVRKFKYGVRICPEPVHWGGLSGCTYSEGVSWGKFVPPQEGGRFAEVFADATIAWPILIKAVRERIDKKSQP